VSKGGLNWKNEIGKSFESRMTSSFDEEDEGPGGNFINILRAVFISANTKSAKKTDGLTVFFVLFGICVHKSFA